MNRKSTSTIALLVAMLLAAAAFQTIVEHGRIVPACEQREVLIGIGDWSGTAWTEYFCGPNLSAWEGEGKGPASDPRRKGMDEGGGGGPGLRDPWRSMNA